MADVTWGDAKAWAAANGVTDDALIQNYADGENATDLDFAAAEPADDDGPALPAAFIFEFRTDDS